MTETPALDLHQMLWELAESGWKPVLYPETAVADHQAVRAWICYPMGDVRAWTSARAPDPAAAVRALWRWAQAHPNEPPAVPSAAAVAGAPAEVPPAGLEASPIACSICQRPESPLTGRALMMMIRSAARLLRAEQTERPA